MGIEESRSLAQRTGIRRAVPAAAWQFIGPFAITADGEIRFPGERDLWILSDRELRAWRDVAYDYWHDGLNDYACTPGEAFFDEAFPDYPRWGLVAAAEPITLIHAELAARRERRHSLVNGS